MSSDEERWGRHVELKAALNGERTDATPPPTPAAEPAEEIDLLAELDDPDDWPPAARALAETVMRLRLELADTRTQLAKAIDEKDAFGEAVLAVTGALGLNSANVTTNVTAEELAQRITLLVNERNGARLRAEGDAKARRAAEERYRQLADAVRAFLDGYDSGHPSYQIGTVPAADLRAALAATAPQTAPASPPESTQADESGPGGATAADGNVAQRGAQQADEADQGPVRETAGDGPDESLLMLATDVDDLTERLQAALTERDEARAALATAERERDEAWRVRDMALANREAAEVAVRTEESLRRCGDKEFHALRTLVEHHERKLAEQLGYPERHPGMAAMVMQAGDTRREVLRLRKEIHELLNPTGSSLQVSGHGTVEGTAALGSTPDTPEEA